MATEAGTTVRDWTTRNVDSLEDKGEIPYPSIGRVT